MNIEEWTENEGIVDFSTSVVYEPTGYPTTPVIGEPSRGLPTVWTQEWPVERPKRRPRPTVILEPREEAPVVEEKKLEFDPILISLVRRAMPNLIAYDICGVQPMSGPTGLIFALRSRYDSGKQRRKERYQYDEDDSSDSCF